MKLNDDVVHGYLSIYKEYTDGTQECVLKDSPNVITLASRRVHLAYLHDYDNTAKDELSYFRAGTGGAVGDSSQGNTNVRVITPDPNRTNLYNPIVTTSRDVTLTPSDPADNTQVFLQVIFSLAQDEANGQFINEVGLFKESNLMFNHKTFTNIEKTEAFSLIFDWKLRYV